LRLSQVVHRIVVRLWLGARRGAADRHHHHLGRALRDAEGEMNGKRIRLTVVLLISAVFLLAWIFPIFWSLLNSLKTERDVLAYPPKLFFQPTLDAYRDVLFGSASIVPNLVSSFII